MKNVVFLMIFDHFSAPKTVQNIEIGCKSLTNRKMSKIPPLLERLAVILGRNVIFRCFFDRSFSESDGKIIKNCNAVKQHHKLHCSMILSTNRVLLT